MVAEVVQHLLQQFPNLLCILIPRHAVRGDGITQELRGRGHRLAQRSKREPITNDISIYLADTMGELGSFYAAGELVFLGGSLVAVGGHNPLEPARLSCAIVTGPHIHNFASVMEKLAAAKALTIVHDKEELARSIASLLKDTQKRHAMAEAAAAQVAQTRGALAPILAHAQQLLPGGVV
jgi:3-deoxy-D-manno-octulosonic-acid transferase